MSYQDDGGKVDTYLTLRDYFAARALQGLVAGVFGAQNVQIKGGGPVTEDALVVQSYIFADKMIEARKK